MISKQAIFQKNFYLTRSSGFSLVEALITLGILAIISTFASSAIVQVLRSNRYAELRFDTQALSQQISEHLKLPETCRLALGSGSPSTQTVDQASLVKAGTDGLSGWQFEISIPGIGTGSDLSGSILSSSAPNNLIGSRSLLIESLRLADGHRLPDFGTDRRFLATVYLKARDVRGMSFQDQAIALTTITISSISGRIVDCQSTPSRALQNSCAEMGCTYDSSQSPPCRCLRSQVMCAAPGSFAVSINEDGYPNCVQAGGDNACPTGEYLAGFGIGYRECVAVPTPVTPSPSAPTPAPSPLPVAPPPPPSPPVLGICRCVNSELTQFAGCGGGVISSLTYTVPGLHTATDCAAKSGRCNGSASKLMQGDCSIAP